MPFRSEDGKFQAAHQSGNRVRYRSPSIPDGGQHLSYFGGVESVQRKLENTAHREYDTDYYKDPERIRKAIEEKRDLFDRDYVKFE